MLRALTILLLVGASVHPSRADARPHQAHAEADEPSPERVAEVRAALDEARQAGDPARLVAALEVAQDVPHPSVVADVVAVLDDEREEVQLAALSSLRWLAHPDALDALEELARNGKRMRSPAFAAAVLRGLGQHADPGSVVLLARTPFEPSEHACLRARVLALGRIRTPESLETLIRMLGATHGARGERRLKAHMEAVRTSLVLLTGLDHGSSPELWEDWWRENRRDFRIPAETPLLPKELREPWDRYWGLPTTYAREKRREDRGQ
jgi:hypothetical protein